MRRLAAAIYLNMALIVVLCLPVCSQARQNEEPESRISYAHAVSLVRSVVETLLREHVDPPTRQQMVLEVTRALDAHLKTPESGNLSSWISDAKDTDDIYGLLLSELSKSKEPNILEKTVIQTLEKVIGSMVLGGLEFESRKNALAAEQVAANRYVGIGVVLSAEEPKKGMQFTKIIDEGPASEGGVIAMDFLDAVDGQSTKDRSIGDVIQWLRGPIDTTVKITVRSKDEPARELSLVRRVVPLKSMELVEKNIDKKALLIRVDQFSASSINELEKLIDKFEKDGTKLEKIVFDLQNTVVDSLHYFHLFADGILDETELCKVKTRKGLRILKTEDGKAIGERQLAILFQPGRSEAIDLLAKSLASANSKAYYWFSDPTEGVGPPTASYLMRNSIELPGSNYFIKTVTSRMVDTREVVLSPDPGVDWKVKPVRGIGAKALIKKNGSVLDIILNKEAAFSSTSSARKP